MRHLDLGEAKEMVACLREGLPYSSSAERFVAASINIPATPSGLSLKTATCYEIFHATERILQGTEDPVGPFRRHLDGWAAFLEHAAFAAAAYTDVPEECFAGLEEETGTHYGCLFREFDDMHYYDEAVRLLRQRFERNEFDLSWVKGKSVLDAGCGGGRYTVALRRLGFGEAVGLDISEQGIAYADDRLKASAINGITFKRGSVLEMPFADDTFDFVFSNGVLHHTGDIRRGIAELVRVLKPGGRGFLYLIEKPGGIFWDAIEILRPMMRDVPYDFARSLFSLLGVPANRRYYILDHVMVPINIRSTPSEVEAMLGQAGAMEIIRLWRGADFDRAEKLYQSVPCATVKFGVAENRYFFKKPEMQERS